MADNVERVILGKRAQVESLIIALICRGNVLIEDVPGTGKTMLARAIAASLGIEFRRLQCTPDLLPGDVTGVSVFDQRTGDFEFRPGPVFVNLLLVDEINRATPRTQAALLEAMEERRVTVDGVTRELPQPFVVLATQNPVEFEGTFPLPEAQLDRFLVWITIGYLDPEEEVQMLGRLMGPHPIGEIGAVADPSELLTLSTEVAAVHADTSIDRYVVDLVGATRHHPDVSLGASPRGTLALGTTARAHAAVRGRDFVTPDDVKLMAKPALGHRIVLGPQARLKGRSAVDIIEELLERVPADADGVDRP